MLLEHKYKNIETSKSKLSLTFTGGGAWKVWDRFISYNDEQLFHIGNICGTCAFFFAQVNEPIKEGISVEETKELLNKGVTVLDYKLVDKLGQLMPVSEYEVSLFRIYPYQTYVNGVKDYFLEEQMPIWYDVDKSGDEPLSRGMDYYRGTDKIIDEETSFYEFFVPLYQTVHLNEERVQYYQKQIQAGYEPTTVAFTMMEARDATHWKKNDQTEYCHCYLVHYLLDGHHKMQAAVREGKPITLISFIQKDKAFDSINKTVKLI